MIHKPIQFKNVCLSFPHKVCFENFSAQVQYGSRIAIMGRNGSGKSTLLKMIQGLIEPTEGTVKLPEDAVFGYVPQVIEDFDVLSGGQRLNKALTQALALDPNVLLLDEPTNHLDVGNHNSLMRMLRQFPNTLIIVSHDVELLRTCVNILWHVDNGKVHVFSGNYDDYRREATQKRASMEHELARLDRQKKETHQSLMKEQERAKKRKIYGEKKYDGDKLALRSAQGKGQITTHKNKKRIADDKNAILEQLSDLRLPEIIRPKFSLSAAETGGRTLVSVREGSVGYERAILTDISLSIAGSERIAIAGDNGSGKSTLVKAVLGDEAVTKSGHWHTPNPDDMGYLDQHYGTLDLSKTVLETIRDLTSTWSHAEIRLHLNDFLFRKNEEVNALVSTLSGGEKARLSLAQIAARTPRLLILDEITNNLDLETREHVIQVLKSYPGAMIVISHDEDFLRAIEINCFYEVKDKKLLG
jgi:ATPase subunit of ABC transporter with duplicated ATPase domains